MYRNQCSIVFLIILFTAACATSEQAKEVQPTGFLGDYSKLRPGGKGEPLLVYRNPKANFRQYDKVLIDPVTIWQGEDSQLREVPKQDLQRLGLLLKVKTIEAVKGEGLQVVHEAGPGVLRIRVALTEAQQSNRTMHVMSSAVPLPSVSKMATGTRAFVGKAAIEGEVSDSVTGEVLFAGVDRRGGGRTFEGIRNPWSHVEKAFQYWSDRFRQRLCEERGKEICVPAE